MLKKSLSFLFILLSFQLYSQEIENYRRLGEEGYKNQDYLVSIENYKEALLLNSNDLKSNIGISNSFYMIGEYEESLFYLNRGLALESDNLELQNLKARTLLALGEYDKSKDIYLGVLEVEPYNINAQSGIAELRIITGDIDGSLREFENIIKFSPKSRRLLLSLVVLNDRKGNFQKSDELIQSSIKLYPTDPVVLKSAVVHYMNSGNYLASTLYIEELLKNSSDPENLLIEAELNILTKKYSKSVETLREYLKVVKDNHYPYYLTAVALDKLGDSKRALSLIDRGLKLSPENEIYRLFSEMLSVKVYGINDSNRNNYSKWYLEAGKQLENSFYYDKARSYYLRGINLDPLNWNLRVGYSNTLNKLGYKKHYIKELELLSSDFPGDNDSSEIGETLEIEKSLPVTGIYSRWPDLDLNNAYKHRVSISTTPSKEELYKSSEEIISYSLNRFLSTSRRFTIESSVVGNLSFSQIFKEARKTNSDYFINFSYKQGRRSFSLKASIYLTDSGRLIKELSYLKIGNDRILNAFDSLIRDLNGILPGIGTIKDIKREEVLFDLGYLDRLESDDKVIVIKKNGFQLGEDIERLVVDDSYYLGTLEISEVGEAHSLGIYSSNNEFNLLNIGDHIIILSDNEEYTYEEEDYIIDYEVIDQLLRIN